MEVSPPIYLTGSWQLFLQKSQSVLSANWACVSTAEIKRLQLPTEMSSPGTAVKHKSKGCGTQTSRSSPPPPPPTSPLQPPPPCKNKAWHQRLFVGFILSAESWIKTNRGLTTGSLPWFLSTCLLFVHSRPFISVLTFPRAAAVKNAGLSSTKSCVWSPWPSRRFHLWERWWSRC